VRWPFDADHLRNLALVHMKKMGQVHLTACPNG
jgi:hypothetical protein